MKIERFNESNTEFNLSSFKKFIDDNSKLRDSIEKYLKFKRPKKKMWYENIICYFRDDEFIIDYHDDFEGTSETFYVTTAEEMSEFLRFINNPDLFLDSEKYNI